MTVLDWFSLIPVGMVLLYIAARFLFVAYFKSREDFEKRHKQINK